MAILDACVLFQGGLTNLLLHLAAADAFEPLWSDAIHAEWTRNLHARLGIPAGKVEYRRGQMERAFPAANVATPPALVADRMGMPKPAQALARHHGAL